MTAAARHLGVDKATVSRHFAELEQSAPAPLFERRRNSIILTPYGERALQAYREHSQAETRFRARLQPSEFDLRGVVRVTMPSFLACQIVVPALPDFIERHPELAVEIDASPNLVDLSAGGADIAVRNIRPEAEDLSLRRVGRLGLSMYGSHSYLQRRGGIRAERDLSGHDFISYDSGPYRGPSFEWLPEAVREARVVFAANDAQALFDATRAGLGLAVLPHLLAESEPTLTRLATAGEGVTDILIVTRSEMARVRRVREVTRFIAEVIQAAQPRLWVPRIERSARARVPT